MKQVFSQRKAYQQKLEGKLEQFRAKLALSKGQAKELVAEQKLAANKKIEQLSQQLSEIKDASQDLQQAGEDAWNQLQIKTEEMLADWSEKLDRLIQEYELEEKQSQQSEA